MVISDCNGSIDFLKNVLQIDLMYASSFASATPYK